jgi:hypothetical protein
MRYDRTVLPVNQRAACTPVGRDVVPEDIVAAEETVPVAPIAITPPMTVMEVITIEIAMVTEEQKAWARPPNRPPP